MKQYHARRCRCMTRRYALPSHFSVRMEFSPYSMPLISSHCHPRRASRQSCSDEQLFAWMEKCSECFSMVSTICRELACVHEHLHQQTVQFNGSSHPPHSRRHRSRHLTKNPQSRCTDSQRCAPKSQNFVDYRTHKTGKCSLT